MQEDTTEQKPKRVKNQPPTPLQRRLAQTLSGVISGNIKVKTSKELLLRAGYSPTMSEKPELVSSQQGVQKALAELGLTKEFVISALREDIEAKPQRRAFELSIAGKWLGLEQRNDKEPTSSTTNNTLIVIQQPQNNVVKPPLDHK
jgi:hypothetical protein